MLLRRLSRIATGASNSNLINYGMDTSTGTCQALQWHRDNGIIVRDREVHPCFLFLCVSQFVVFWSNHRIHHEVFLMLCSLPSASRREHQCTECGHVSNEQRRRFEENVHDG